MPVDTGAMLGGRARLVRLFLETLRRGVLIVNGLWSRHGGARPQRGRKFTPVPWCMCWARDTASLTATRLRCVRGRARGAGRNYLAGLAGCTRTLPLPRLLARGRHHAFHDTCNTHTCVSSMRDLPHSERGAARRVHGSSVPDDDGRDLS